MHISSVWPRTTVNLLGIIHVLGLSARHRDGLFIDQRRIAMMAFLPTSLFSFLLLLASSSSSFCSSAFPSSSCSYFFFHCSMHTCDSFSFLPTGFFFDFFCFNSLLLFFQLSRFMALSPPAASRLSLRSSLFRNAYFEIDNGGTAF